MKQLMGQLAAMLLNNIDVEPSHLTDADAEQVDVLVEELNDLVCDMDLALDFCTMGGLQLVWRFLVYSFVFGK